MGAGGRQIAVRSLRDGVPNASADPVWRLAGSGLKNRLNRLLTGKFALVATLLVAAASTAAFAQQSAKLQSDAAAASMRLPPGFIGCWRGTIEGDDFKPATPGNTISKDPATYELCYREEAEGIYRLDLLKLVIGANAIRPESFESQVLSADGQTGAAELRSHLVLNQTRYVLWTVPIRVRVDVAAVEDCSLRNRDVISMHGTQLISVNGQKYGEQTFHADFTRVDAPSATAR